MTYANHVIHSLCNPWSHGIVIHSYSEYVATSSGESFSLFFLVPHIAFPSTRYQFASARVSPRSIAVQLADQLLAWRFFSLLMVFPVHRNTIPPRAPWTCILCRPIAIFMQDPYKAGPATMHWIHHVCLVHFRLEAD